MRRVGPHRRGSGPSADAFGSMHERARLRAAQRVDGPLGARESAWLDEHLAECSDCRLAAAEYGSHAEALRSLTFPEPPRDLWARTSAALDRETAARPRRGLPSLVSLVPVGALAGVLVVAVVVGASVFNPTVPQVTTGLASATATASSVAVAPQSTPLAVAAGEVQFVTRSADGRYELTSAAVPEVCAATSAASCPALAAISAGSMVLPDPPGSLIISPNEKQLVVVDQAASTSGGSVSVVAVPTSAPSASPSQSSTVVSSPPPSSTVPSTPPSPSVAASPSASASVGPTPPATGSPSPSSSDGTSSSVMPIARDVILVGHAAAYSTSGRWFAFSARPADGSRGPDIYVWSAGQPSARAVTTDHRSVFSTWIGDEILGSRAVEPATIGTGTGPSPSPPAVAPPPPASSASPSDPGLGFGVGGDALSAAVASPSLSAPVAAQSFLVDPESGRPQVIAGEDLYRPVIDPTGRFVVYWQGTIRTDTSGVDWQPADGHLVLAQWDPSTLRPTPVPSSGSGSAAPGAAASDALPLASPVTDLVTLTSGAIPDFDVRWDESGSHLAVWIAESFDQGRGRLTLHAVEPSGQLDPTGPLVIDQPALAGYSIEAGRLAWVTVPGTSGDGSRVEVLAWRGEHAGTIQSQPGTDLSVVR